MPQDIRSQIIEHHENGDRKDKREQRGTTIAAKVGQVRAVVGASSSGGSGVPGAETVVKRETGRKEGKKKRGPRKGEGGRGKIPTKRKDGEC